MPLLKHRLPRCPDWWTTPNAAADRVSFQFDFTGRSQRPSTNYDVSIGMSAIRLYKAQELCRQAAALPEAQRANLLDSACGSDQALRREVEFILRMEAHETSAAHSPSVTASVQKKRTEAETAAGDVAFETPDHVGPYRLLEQVGVGGFGIVYLAEQEKPVRRKVALKIIKLGMDTREVVNRFEAERQALAMMDHPAVAKVFDGGATPTGRPYFVMEYVAGEPITAYCDKQKLSIEERLELFITVCEAVQHAHTKGIIHRDIKPSNVLAKPSPDSGTHATSASAGRASVKVIDFGVAKAINQRLSENTVHTHQGQIIGTPAYMSPEQAEMGGSDVDTRTAAWLMRIPTSVLDALRTSVRSIEGTQPSSIANGFVM